MSVVYLDREAFIAKCAKDDSAVMAEIRTELQRTEDKFKPAGWVMLECQLLDSSSRGQLSIVPFGPHNTWKTIPEGPVSPRGLASDMSVVVAVCLREPSPRVVEVVFQYDESGNCAQICYYYEGNLESPPELESEFVRLVAPIVEKYSDVQIDLRAAESLAAIYEISREAATTICQEVWNILKAAGWLKSDDPDDGNLEVDENLPVV